MRLQHLFESKTNTLVIELGDQRLYTTVTGMTESSITLEVNESQQQDIEEAREFVTELLPLAIGAVGAGMSAYDAYRAYKDFKAGNITQAQLATQVGSNAAMNLISGGAAKLAQKAAQGAKAGVQAIKRRLGGDAPDAPATPAPRKSRRNRRDFDYNGNQADYTGDLHGTVSQIARFESADCVIKLPLNESLALDRINESNSNIWLVKVC